VLCRFSIALAIVQSLIAKFSLATASNLIMLRLVGTRRMADIEDCSEAALNLLASVCSSEGTAMMVRADHFGNP